MNVSIEEIKEAAERGHSIDTLVAMLEKKASLFSQNRHWFIIKNGRNICEFCGCQYVFGGETMCNASVPE